MPNPQLNEPSANSRLILRILHESDGPLGSRRIAAKLVDHGVAVSERGVRYHLKALDERGLTDLIGRKDGRVITKAGLEELNKGRVREKVGLAISRIETMAYQTTFDPAARTGAVPVNVSLIPRELLPEALKIMAPIFRAGLVVSDLVGTAEQGETLGRQVIPEGQVGLATVCSVVFNGVLLKRGIPMESKFGGILQMAEMKPLRFSELIHYSGSSLDPSEAFIRAHMTSVNQVAANEHGMILANFRELPEPCLPAFLDLVKELKTASIGGLLGYGRVSETLCQIPVNINRVGIVLTGGLNPLAGLHEAGFPVQDRGMAGVMEYGGLMPFNQAARQWNMSV